MTRTFFMPAKLPQSADEPRARLARWTTSGHLRGPEMQKRPHGRARASKLRLLHEFYERAAAAAFFAAFTAVAALRRRLVLGGVAGASPINSAVMMLVTKSFGP